MKQSNNVILHIDFNSYFATVEQQANPRLRGKPVGVTGGDRTSRTVLSTASVEAKRLGVKTGMQLWEAKRVCPSIIILPGDSDKYLECSKRFWNILKSYSPQVEIFSIDEAFIELPTRGPAGSQPHPTSSLVTTSLWALDGAPRYPSPLAIEIAYEIKERIRLEIGEWVTCSVGISYNKLMAKLASSLQKPDGLVVIASQNEAIKVLDRVELDEICGIGPRIKKRLFDMGITDFKRLRQVPKEALLASFKSYGEILYNMARGVDERPIQPFYEREEVKSIGHRHTISHDTSDLEEIRQILLKICEMVAVRARAKKLVGKTIHCWYRCAFTRGEYLYQGGSMQITLPRLTDDGLEVFKGAWKAFSNIWNKEDIRMIGASLSALKPSKPTNLSFLPEEQRRQKIVETIDRVNNKLGEFVLKRGVLMGTDHIKRRPNPYLSDRRFKL